MFMRSHGIGVILDLTLFISSLKEYMRTRMEIYYTQTSIYGVGMFMYETAE